jgi:hypothetical protein
MTQILVFSTASMAGAFAQPLSVDIKSGPLPIRILAQSPADTTTEPQAICLFRSSPDIRLHGSLT